MNAVAAQHALEDRYIAKTLMANPEMKPCCTPGCSACCSEAVYASEAEVLHIIGGLTLDQIGEVKARLPEWLAKTKPLMDQDMPNATAYRLLDAPCVLLQNKLCSAYERRPFGCRVWFALQNPSHCDLPHRTHQLYAYFSNDLFRATGVPAMLNGKLMFDHLGVLLAEKLLGLKIPTASRKTNKLSDFKNLC